MAKISNKTIYPQDDNVTMDDYLIGTNANNYNRTQTYSVQSFFNLFNLSFKFSDGSNPDIGYLEKGYFFTENNETDPEQVTKFIFNNKNLLGQDITMLFGLLADQGNFVIRLTNSSDPNNVIFIRCSNIVFDTMYFSFDSVIYSGLYNGNLSNNSTYAIAFEISVSSDQDNKHKPVYRILYDEISESTVANIINNSQPFVISEQEIPLIVIFRLVTTPVPKLSTFKYFINNYGKGTYGIGGNIVLTADDVELIFSSAPSTNDIINDPSTDVIIITDLGMLSISQYINLSSPPYVIQDQADGLTVFQTGTAPNVIAYLFLGNGGTYGFGQSQTTDADFQLITDTAGEPITSTSQITNNGEDGINPFVTQEDIDASIANKADLVGGVVPSSQLPSYVDDVLEFPDMASFPNPGETGKIYIADNTNKQYRWSGSNYIQITNGLIASTSDVPEGTNLYFTAARVLATLLTGVSFAIGGPIVPTDSILVAFGKIQKQITDALASIALKQDLLVSGTNIKTVNSTSLLGPGNIRTSQVLLLDNAVRSFTGSATPQTVGTYVIPANTIPASCNLRVTCRFTKTGTAGTFLVALANTSMPQARLINNVGSGAATNIQMQIMRNVAVSGGKLRGFDTSGSTYIEFTANTGILSNFDFDITIPQTFELKMTPATTTDTVTFDYLLIEMFN